MMKCSRCGKEKPIQNKTHNLCADCVFEKNHGGKSKQEVYSERAKKREIKPFKAIKSKIKVKPQREEERLVKQLLSALKMEIEVEAIQNDEYYCKGCGKSEAGLDKSHIIAVGERKDLELVKENIQLMCRSCHKIWESKSVNKMINLNCFLENLEIIKKLDENLYKRYKTKFEEYLKQQK